MGWDGGGEVDRAGQGYVAGDEYFALDGVCACPDCLCLCLCLFLSLSLSCSHGAGGVVETGRVLPASRGFLRERKQKKSKKESKNRSP